MKTGLLLAAIMFVLPSAFSQQPTIPPPVTGEFQITRITRDLIPTPQFTHAGGAQHPATNTRDRWLEVEVEFKATPELTTELTFKYYILFNGTLLIGEVTHVNIPAGRENRSVMYIPPRTLARFANKRAITENSCQNIAVQIVQDESVKTEASLNRAQPQWFEALPQVSGLVLNKDQTPFAPLYWDRYEQIKTSR